MGELVTTTVLRVLLSATSGHDVLLAAVLITAWVIIGAALAVILVALAPSDDRVSAIHAAAEVLRALLPWAAWRRTPGDHLAGHGDSGDRAGRLGRRDRDPRHEVSSGSSYVPGSPDTSTTPRRRQTGVSRRGTRSGR